MIEGSPPALPMATRLALFTAALFALALLAFWPLYLSRPPSSVDGYTHVHAALGTAWLVMLAAQSLLAARRKLSAHRLIGRVSLALAPAFVVSSLLLAHYRFSRMPEEVFAREGHGLYLPAFVGGLFAWAYAAAIRWRKSPHVHARFMAATAVLFIDPVLGRVMAFYLPPLPAFWCYQAITFPIVAAILYGLLRTTPAAAPGRAAFRTYLIAVVILEAVWFVTPWLAPWKAFAAWFRGLPLT
jgi:hypothetical protein